MILIYTAYQIKNKYISRNIIDLDIRAAIALSIGSYVTI